MTDEPVETAAEATSQPAAPAARTRNLLPWAAGLGFLVLAGAIAFVWLQPLPPTDLRDIDVRLSAIEARLQQLEQRPVSVAKLDLGPLTTRLDSLERRPMPDLASLQNRISGLEQRPAADMDGLMARLTKLEQTTARGERLARVQAAMGALAAGQKLGMIADAPPALARFANANPPTEAGLRLAFPAAERAALLASRPEQADSPFLTRVLARAEALVTVRQGERVLVGDPASGVLTRARKALDAGDLSGAIDALSTLRGASAAAMAGWVADATALRDARLALSALATGS
jgi:hypothetical protein